MIDASKLFGAFGLEVSEEVARPTPDFEDMHLRPALGGLPKFAVELVDVFTFEIRRLIAFEGFISFVKIHITGHSGQFSLSDSFCHTAFTLTALTQGNTSNLLSRLWHRQKQ